MLPEPTTGGSKTPNRGLEPLRSPTRRAIAATFAGSQDSWASRPVRRGACYGQVARAKRACHVPPCGFGFRVKSCLRVQTTRSSANG